MASLNNIPLPKPRSELYRPELTRLPRLTTRRKLVRSLMRMLARLLLALFTRTKVRGQENIPRHGGVLAVSNHLGDTDMILGLAFSGRPADFIAKIELYDLPVIGKLMDAYGVIWIHRGQPDRRALRAALDALAEGRMVVITPEGRESVTGALEEGTSGAAFLALKSGVPILPAALTGTENAHIFPNLKRLRRSTATLTFGKPFSLPREGKMQAAIDQGTEVIMSQIASLLPPEYRGVHQTDLEMTI